MTFFCQQNNDCSSFSEFRQLDTFSSPILSFSANMNMTCIENVENYSLAANNSNRVHQTSLKRTDNTITKVAAFHHGTKIRKSSSLTIDSPNSSCNNKLIHLQRCWSETEATIMNAVHRSSQDPSLIGDFSRPYALPLIHGRHQDLKSIDVEVLAQVLRGHYNDLIDKCIIVDCRYPYEYHGGHIKGAINIYSKDGIINEFLCARKTSLTDILSNQVSPKRQIIVFHCEFSSERGPSL